MSSQRVRASRHIASISSDHARIRSRVRRADRLVRWCAVDLHDGHIGDGLPLCNALAPRAFLRAGARYTYLGTRSKSRTTTAYDLGAHKTWSGVYFLGVPRSLARRPPSAAARNDRRSRPCGGSSAPRLVGSSRGPVQRGRGWQMRAQKRGGAGESPAVRCALG